MGKPVIRFASQSVDHFISSHGDTRSRQRSRLVGGYLNVVDPLSTILAHLPIWVHYVLAFRRSVTPRAPD